MRRVRALRWNCVVQSRAAGAEWWSWLTAGHGWHPAGWVRNNTSCTPWEPQLRGVGCVWLFGGTLKPSGSPPNNFKGLWRETHRQLGVECWLCACLPSWCGFSAASELPMSNCCWLAGGLVSSRKNWWACLSRSCSPFSRLSCLCTGGCRCQADEAMK